MSSISVSNYHKYIELQNVSSSGDPTAAPEGGVYLFASGTSAAPNTARLYMQNEGGSVTDLSKTLDIDAFDALGGTGVDQADNFVFSDGGTEKKITFSNLEDAIFGNVSGDATIAAGGALTIANDAVEQAMIADDAVGADQLAANAVVNASIASNAAIDLNKIDGGSADNSLSDLAQTDLLYAGDVDDSNEIKKITFSDFEDAIFGNVSGDATIAAGGALTIANAAVEHAMLANDAVDGDNIADDSVNSEHIVLGALDAEHYSSGSIQTGHITDNAVTLAKMAGLARGKFIVGDASGDPSALSLGSDAQMLISDGSDLAYVSLSGDVSIANNGAVTIAANAVEGSMLNSNVAGSGLDYGSNELSVDVSDFMANGANNRIVTATGTDAMNGEANLTFDGSALAVVGTVSGSSTLHAVGAITGGSTLAVSGTATLQAVNAQALTATSATLSGDLSSSSGAHFVGALSCIGNFEATGTVKAVSHLIAGGNTIKDGSGNTVIGFDGAGNGGFDANFTVGGGFGSTGVTISSAGSIQADGSLTVTDAQFGGGYGSSGLSISNAGVIQMDGGLTAGSDGAGVNFKVFGAAANEFLSYDASTNLLQLNSSGGDTIVSLGGDATSEFAVDVGNGSNNQNKIRAAAFVTYSDESLKEDVASMSNTALDTVMSLNGVEFTWKDSGERDFGFIAQDVQSVLPKAVHTAENGVQGVDYSRLTSILVEAVKAQQVQIEDLKKALKK